MRLMQRSHPQSAWQLCTAGKQNDQCELIALVQSITKQHAMESERVIVCAFRFRALTLRHFETGAIG